MYGTLISLALAIFLLFNPTRIIEYQTPIVIAMFIVAALFILAQIAITVAGWGPLQKAMQNLTPRLLEAIKRDRNLSFSKAFLVAFLLFTFFGLLNSLMLNQINPLYFIAAWTVFLGISVDLLYFNLKKIMEFLDPYYAVDYFTGLAQKCLGETKETELCEWIDTISETAVKAITRDSTSLGMHAVEKLRVLTKNYLDVAKGITYHPENSASKIGGADHVSYILFYIFQRMEMIFDKALHSKQEPVCSKIVTNLGKISIDGAKFDISVAEYPLHYLGKFALKAQREGMQEVGNRAMITLLEVSRTIINDINLQYLEIKDPFLVIVTNMHEIAKNTFRNDKKMNIQLLIQPFYQLKEFFQSQKMAEHPDSEVIVRNINMAVEEFIALENVMSTLPPIPEIVKEREAMEQEEKKPSAEG